VSFDKINAEDYADNYFGLKAALEALLHHPVDLMEEQAIHNPFLRSSIDTTKKLLYGH
jgi:predicted nucleotidyltransferase